MNRFGMGAAVAAALAIAPLAGADAALVSRDYATAGDGLLTYDDATGLEWLDFSVSQGQTVTQSLAQNSGFALATKGQVATLLGDFGFNHVNLTTDYTYYADDVAPAVALDEMIGHTLTAIPGLYYFTGGHVQGATADTYDAWRLEYYYFPYPGGGISNYFQEVGNNYGSGSSNEANFLVRTAAAAAVPEPATWLMMLAGFGLVGAALRGRSPGRRMPVAAA